MMSEKDLRRYRAIRDRRKKPIEGTRILLWDKRPQKKARRDTKAKEIERIPDLIKKVSKHIPFERMIEQYGNWLKIYTVKGKYIFVLRPDKYSGNEFTLTGSTDNIDLLIPFHCLVQKIELSFDDATSKTLDIYHRSAYSAIPTNPPEIFSLPANTWQTFIITLEENENEFEKEATLRIAVNGTANKKVKPVIYLRRQRD